MEWNDQGSPETIQTESPSFDWDLATQYGGAYDGYENDDESSGSVTLPYCVQQCDTGARETVWFAGSTRSEVERMVNEYLSACTSVHGACMANQGTC